jgi:hypothetical protein
MTPYPYILINMPGKTNALALALYDDRFLNSWNWLTSASPLRGVVVIISR